MDFYCYFSTLKQQELWQSPVQIKINKRSKYEKDKQKTIEAIKHSRGRAKVSMFVKCQKIEMCFKKSFKSGQ